MKTLEIADGLANEALGARAEISPPLGNVLYLRVEASIARARLGARGSSLPRRSCLNDRPTSRHRTNKA